MCEHYFTNNKYINKFTVILKINLKEILMKKKHELTINSISQ